jgi:hypothetical protein
LGPSIEPPAGGRAAEAVRPWTGSDEARNRAARTERPAREGSGARFVFRFRAVRLTAEAVSRWSARFRTATMSGSDVGRSPELLFPFSARGSGEPLAAGLPHPPMCAHRFSQPLDALLPPQPSGLVASRWHSWGLYPSEVFPRESPDTSRLAVPLLTFIPKDSSPGVSANSRIRACARRPLKGSEQPILSWASPSPGDVPIRGGARLHVASPHVLSKKDALGRPTCGTPGYRSTDE